MSDPHILILNRRNRDKAIQGVVMAPDGWALELREPTRSDEQNNALHGLIAQIMRQRKFHNGIRMNKVLWKATFMQALGEEIKFIPTLDGDSMFPLGLSTKRLGKEKFSQLIELVLAWCAREGLTVEHFNDGQEPGVRQERPPVAA